MSLDKITLLYQLIEPLCGLNMIHLNVHICTNTLYFSLCFKKVLFSRSTGETRCSLKRSASKIQKLTMRRLIGEFQSRSNAVILNLITTRKADCTVTIRTYVLASTFWANHLYSIRYWVLLKFYSKQFQTKNLIFKMEDLNRWADEDDSYKMGAKYDMFDYSDDDDLGYSSEE